MNRVVLTASGVCLLGFFGYLALWPQKKNASCAFCEKRVLDSQVFYISEKSQALLTHKPAAKGHLLIIPKRHVERFEDLTQEEMVDLQETIKKVDVVARKIYGYKDYLLLQKNGPLAGQSVPHVHFHYLPAAPFLSVRFFVSPWLPPLSEDRMRALKNELAGSI